ncbi:hypothetical protein SUGI_0074890 [Cryptomeria japonica]|nr:hypothetical protein SUGI_0074890 [Cryptomeria japonica]
MEAGSVSRRLQEITRDMAKALEMLSLGLLAVSKEVVDHMELVRIHLRSTPERGEEESNLVRELEEAVARLERKDKGAPPDVKRLRGLFLCLGLHSLSKCRVADLIAGRHRCRTLCHGEITELDWDAVASDLGSVTSRLVGKEKDDGYWNVTEELKCPISLDLMRDPVIVDQYDDLS